jgi:hypothetical protein
MANLRAGSALPCVFTLLLGAVACSACSESGDDERSGDPPATARCPVVTRAGGCRAAARNEVVTIASGGMLLPAAGFPLAGGGFVAFSVRWGDARILSSKSTHSWAFDDASTLPWSQANAATGVTTAEGKHALYFVARTSAAPSLQVASLEGDVLAQPEPVVLDGAEGVPSWPQAVGLADGRVLLAFVVPQTRVIVGVDDGTGKRFRVAPVDLPEPDLRGVLASVATTARGAWVLTYQVADAWWRFRSHVLLSRDDGLTWSDPEAGRLSADDGSVSGPFALARADEGADVYYAKAATSTGKVTGMTSTERAIWRRALHEDGTLGPEQLVTSASLGKIGNAQARRLPNGRIALMLALERGPEEKDLGLVVLDGDAP